MNHNEQTLIRFCSAFAALDADTMANCYAEDAIFEDPAFSLKGRHDVGGMWHMLCDATKSKGREDWRLEFRDIHSDDAMGRAHREAHYRFSVTRRVVHNIIETEFTFTPEGLIATHKDVFGMYVPDRFRKQGLGRQLIGEVIRYARTRPGTKIIQLTVTTGICHKSNDALELCAKSVTTAHVKR